MTIIAVWIILSAISQNVASGQGTRVRYHSSQPIKTIQGADGDIIDCVNIYDQPAFMNPLLKVHKIKLSPSNITRKRFNKLHFTSQQTWNKSGSCPFGAIPILRMDHEQNASMQAFKLSLGMKDTDTVREAAIAYARRPTYTSFGGVRGVIDIWQPRVEPNELSLTYILIGSKEVGGTEDLAHYVLTGWMAAIAYARRPTYTSFGGVRGVIDIWQPHVESNELSLTYILIGSKEVGGTEDLAHYVLTGWMVCPSKFGGDVMPRMVVDRSGSTGYNFGSGFIQTSRKIVIGSRITPPSAYGGQRRTLLFTINKDQFSSWWVYIGTEPVGYFPNELFESFRKGDMAHFGGIILNSNPGGKHTATQMGSGHFSGEGETKAGKISSIFTLDYHEREINVFPNLKEVTNPNCYDLNIVGVEPPQYGYSIYYGGPGGQDPRCT